jgi:hypothetical protein
LAALTVFAMAASSPQCSRTADTSLGAGFEPAAADPVLACELGCKATYRAGLREERRRHRLADRACNGDEQCHLDEEALHQAILAQLVQDLNDCITACQHEQGGGGAGQ